MYRAGVLFGVQFDTKKYTLFAEFSRAVPLVVAYSGLAVVSRWPTHVHWRDGVLHCTDGMAVQWSDGWGLWSIGGVAVDEQIVMRPETQIVAQITAETNEEVKRIRIERFGWDRYLHESHAKCIDRRRNDIEGTREALYRMDGHAVLVCVCPSTAKIFSLEVPPDTESCRVAQQYLSSGLDGRIISAS